MRKLNQIKSSNLLGIRLKYAQFNIVCTHGPVAKMLLFSFLLADDGCVEGEDQQCSLTRNFGSVLNMSITDFITGSNARGKIVKRGCKDMNFAERSYGFMTFDELYLFKIIHRSWSYNISQY